MTFWQKRRVDLSGNCGSCRHFLADAATLEEQLGGFASLGSAYGSVRAGDGLCRHHNRYLSARAQCVSHAARDDVDAPIRDARLVMGR